MHFLSALVLSFLYRVRQACDGLWPIERGHQVLGRIWLNIGLAVSFGDRRDQSRRRDADHNRQTIVTATLLAPNRPATHWQPGGGAFGATAVL
jgi:hypothetical protein